MPDIKNMLYIQKLEIDDDKCELMSFLVKTELKNIEF